MELMPLDAQIACAERELMKRIAVYPQLVARGKISQATSSHEQACMRAIVTTLQQVETQRKGGVSPALVPQPAPEAAQPVA